LLLKIFWQRVPLDTIILQPAVVIRVGSGAGVKIGFIILKRVDGHLEHSDREGTCVAIGTVIWVGIREGLREVVDHCVGERVESHGWRGPMVPDISCQLAHCFEASPFMRPLDAPVDEQVPQRV
jgi:hypothetical protein